MFAVIPEPYEGFRGCLLTTENNSVREGYILLAVVEAGKYVEETNVRVGSYTCEVVMALMVISAYKSCLCLLL
jgi:hypothetical protein